MRKHNTYLLVSILSQQFNMYVYLNQNTHFFKKYIASALNRCRNVAFLRLSIQIIVFCVDTLNYHLYY